MKVLFVDCSERRPAHDGVKSLNPGRGDIMHTMASGERESTEPGQSSDLRLILDSFKHVRLVSGCEARCILAERHCGSS